MSFALIVAACGGGDDGDTADTDAPAETDDSGAEETNDTEAPSDTDAPPETDTEDTGIVEGEIDEEIEETDGEPVPGGTIRYGIEADVDGLNPTTSVLTAPGLIMANAVFDTLTAWDVDGIAVPYLAESVEPVDGDFSTWQITLRSGITFHDDTPLDADAVMKNFQTQRSDLIVGTAVRPFFPCSPTLDADCESGIEPAEIIDDLTIQYHLLEPNAYFPGSLAGQLGMISSPKWLDEALEDATLNQNPVGTGPFTFDSRSEDSITRFVRHDDWWNGDVYLDAIEFLPDTDPDSRADRLFGGELQALHTSNAATVGDLTSDDSVQNVVDETGEDGFAMINTEAPPFDDVRARRALALATPLTTFDALIGLGITRQADQRFIPESKYFNPDVMQEGDLPDEAVALAAEYCADRGGETNPVTGQSTCTEGKINIELQFPGPAVVQTRMADILDEGWSVAFNVTFDKKAEDEHVKEALFGQYNVAGWRSFGAVDPALENVWLLCRTVGGISLNLPRLCDEELDALLLQAQATTDEAERISLYQQATQRMHDGYAYIFTQHTIWDNAFASEVRGQCDRVSPEGVALRCVALGRSWHDSLWLAE